VQLDALTQAIFLEMFGDPVDNPKGWPTRKLSALGTIERGVSTHRRETRHICVADPPFVQTGEHCELRRIHHRIQQHVF
jgi:type I restriction enzyme S subunit